MKSCTVDVGTLSCTFETLLETEWNGEPLGYQIYWAQTSHLNGVAIDEETLKNQAM